MRAASYKEVNCCDSDSMVISLHGCVSTAGSCCPATSRLSAPLAETGSSIADTKTH